ATSGLSINQPRFYKREINSNTGCFSQGCFAITSEELVLRSSSSYIPISNSMAGSFIGYSIVEEEIGLNAEFGKKQLTFHNEETFYENFEYELENFPRYYDRMNGALLNEKVYNASGALVQETTNNYTKVNTNVPRQWIPRFQRIFNVTGDQIPVCNETAISHLYFYSYTPQWIQLTQSSVETYGTVGGSTIVTTNNSYKPENYQINSSTVSNGIDSRTTNYYYAGDTGYPEIDFNTNNILANNFMIAIPIATEIENGLGGGFKVNYTESNGLIVPSIFFQRRDAIESNSVWKKVSEVLSFDGLAYPEIVWRHTLNQPIGYTWTDGLLMNKTYQARNWTYAYTDRRFLQSMTDHQGIGASFEFDDLGRLEHSESRNGRIIKDYIYDISLALGGQNLVTTNHTYSTSPFPIESLTEENEFDYFGRSMQNNLLGYTFDGNDYQTGNTYDNLSRAITEDNPNQGGTSTMNYEASVLSRLLTVTPAGTSDQISTDYDVESNRIKTLTTDENGNTSYQVVDLYGNVVKSVDAVGNITTMSYNDRDQLLQVNPPDNGAPYIYTYYPDGKLETKTIPNQGTFSYTYYSTDQVETELNQMVRCLPMYMTIFIMISSKKCFLMEHRL
ncbi:MAG: hypothetical protein AAGK97_04590, partial [Bacteroidota bacterium]